MDKRFDFCYTFVLTTIYKSILSENKLLFDELVVLDQHVKVINLLAH